MPTAAAGPTLRPTPKTASTPTAVPPIVRAINLHKTYRLGRVDVPVLHGVSLDINPGEWVAVLGASGSGKSTLMHLLGGLDRPDRAAKGQPQGEVQFDGRAIAGYSARQLDRYRCSAVGFVFQFYHLLSELSVLENVLIGSMIRHGHVGYRTRAGELRERGRSLLDRVGLSHRLAHRPAELSGGERQRVAIARALINQPKVLLADEPTGNLDRHTGDKILDLLAEFHRQGQTMVVVTHDPETARRADRVVRLQDGRVVAA